MMSPVPLWFAGKEATSDTTFDIHSPTTDEKLWASSTVSPSQACDAVDAAQSALKHWRKARSGDIRDILLKAADVFDERASELKGYMMQETGALEDFADFNLKTVAELCRDVAGRVAAAREGSVPQTDTPGQSAFILHEPYGVTLGIAPWNAPYILGTRAFLYAIATGNTAILKGSELCPKTFWAIGSVFKQANLPDGVLSVIVHQPQDAAAVTNAIIEHPAVRKVSFTGSTLVGSIIARKCGEELKPILMELGGKSSAIVCEDADLELAATQIAVGAFLNSGQICMSTERVLVHSDVFEPFSRALKRTVDKIFPPSADAPVLVSDLAVEKNKKLVRQAASKGAQVLHGDVEKLEANAHRLRPIILSDVTKEMDIFHAESFGPTVSLIKVNSDEEAIEVANDTEYGLSGAVFTRSLSKGLRIAKEIESGAIHINSMSVHDEATLPHGGVKKSGWGRSNGRWGLQEFLRLKTITYIE